MFFRNLYIAILLISWASPSFTEVVKWVDENGKIHFGDRVPEKYRKQSEAINVSETNVAETTNLPRRHRNETPASPRQNTYEQKQAEKRRAKQERLNEACRKAEDHYKSIASLRHSHTTLFRDGKSGRMLSREEQNAIAEEYRKKINQQGCSINPL